MADINLTVYKTGRGAGVNLTDNATAATAGNTYKAANDGRVKLIANCIAGGTMTVQTPNLVDGNAIADKTLALTAGKTLIFGPFPVGVYGSTLVVSVDANTSLLAFSE